MKKYLLKTAFISSHIFISYAAVKLIKSIIDFKNITDNIDFSGIRKESNRIIESAELRRV